MKIFACGEAQRVDAPGEFLEGRTLGRVVGVGDLGGNNSQNSFGWTGVKAVIHVGGHNYVLDFPETATIETDDGLEFINADQGEADCWSPSLEDRQEYGLYLFDLQSVVDSRPD